MNVYQRMVAKLQMKKEIIAKEWDYIPNPDFMHRKKIEEAIKNNDGYCCCALEKNDDTLCICKAFKEQDHSGFCHCGRYYKILKSPKVCLCGSTRFKDKFFEVARDLTLKGCIVTMPMVFVHSGDEDINEVQKEYLDEVHKAKIAYCDVVYVINVDGYIGKSTRSEINWAAELGKKIEYLEK